MPPKTIKKKSPAKRESPRRVRSAGTTTPRRTLPSAEEELFAKAFRSSPHPIGITELETGRCLEVNNACLEIFGFRRDEVVGHTTLMLGIWPDPQERTRFIDRVKSEGTVRNLEVSMRMKDGELRQFLFSTDLIALNGKQCLLTMGNDITERKQAEEALRQSEERWQLAATGTTDGIWDWDVVEHTVFLSLRWKRVRGYRDEEIGVEETEWSSRIHPEDFSRVMATVHSYFNKEIPTFDCEYRTRRKDGTYYWVNDRGVAVWDSQGRVVRMVGSETDITERKQREHALAEQRRLYKTVTDNAVLALFIMDDSQQCVFMNPAAEALTGFALAEVMGRPLHDVVHHTRPDGSPYLLSECPIDQAFPKNDRERGEEVFVHKDGHFYSVAFTASPVRNELGQPVGTVIEVQDITERKQAEAERQKFVSLADQSLEFIGMCDLDFKPFYVNQAGQRLVGLDSLEQACAVRVQDYFFPEDRAMIIGEFFPRVLRQGHGEVVVRFRHFKTGEALWMIYNVFQVRDENDRVAGYATVSRDITERKRAEEALRRLNETLEQRVSERSAALRESEGRLQGMLDHSPNLIFMKDLHGRYMDANKQFEQTFHFTRQDIIGKTDHDMFPPERAAVYRADDLEVLKAGRSLQFEETALHDDGLHTNIVWKFPLRRLDGTPYAICGIVTDITERKQAEETLRQQQRELQRSEAQLHDLASKLLTAQEDERRRIARDLHDDFSQRLGALVLDVTSLQRQPPLSPELIEKALEPVREELTQLTEDLHDLAYRLHPPLLQSVGLQAAIEDSIHKAMERTGLQITLTAQHLPSSIPLDWSTCLFRVFQESLQNVAKHAKATDVLVKLSGSSKGIGLSVLDNGKGFDERDKDGHQNGLGLTSMRERLRLVNGFLNIHSRTADGTKVCAWIPFQEKTS